MKLYRTAATLMFLLTVACSNNTGSRDRQSTPAPRGSTSTISQTTVQGKLFLDWKREVLPGQEWIREVGTVDGGIMTLRLTSDGPLSISLVSDRGKKALEKGDQKMFRNEDVLFTADSKGQTFERSMRLPEGSSWFIIKNRTNERVRMQLECFGL